MTDRSLLHIPLLGICLNPQHVNPIPHRRESDCRSWTEATKNELAAEIERHAEHEAELFQLWQAENEEQTAVRVRAQRLANERDESRGETRLALALLHSAEDECDRYKAALEAMVARHPDAVPGEHPAVDLARSALGEVVPNE